MNFAPIFRLGRLDQFWNIFWLRTLFYKSIPQKYLSEIFSDINWMGNALNWSIVGSHLLISLLSQACSKFKLIKRFYIYTHIYKTKHILRMNMIECFHDSINRIMETGDCRMSDFPPEPHISWRLCDLFVIILEWNV